MPEHTQTLVHTRRLVHTWRLVDTRRLVHTWRLVHTQRLVDNLVELFFSFYLNMNLENSSQVSRIMRQVPVPTELPSLFTNFVFNKVQMTFQSELAPHQLTAVLCSVLQDSPSLKRTGSLVTSGSTLEKCHFRFWWSDGHPVLTQSVFITLGKHPFSQIFSHTIHSGKFSCSKTKLALAEHAGISFIPMQKIYCQDSTLKRSISLCDL